MPDMLLTLETLFTGREQSLLPASRRDKADASPGPEAEVSSPGMTSRDYFSEIRQLRQQL